MRGFGLQTASSRRPGGAPDGTRLLPRAWIDSSWTVRTTSGWSGNDYGYGWWIRRSHGHQVNFAWATAAVHLRCARRVDGRRRYVGPRAGTPGRLHRDAVHGLVDAFLAPELPAP